MRLLILVSLLAGIASLASSQVYFPLHVGDAWNYEDQTSVTCEGTSIIYSIQSDTILGGRQYFKFIGMSPYSGPFVRADSVRVYEFDTTSHSEEVVFDFTAPPGDTVSIRDNGNKVTIALGNLKFSIGQTVFTIRDSIGVVLWNTKWNLCMFELTGAWIDGRFVTTNVPLSSPGVPAHPYLEPNYPNPFNPSTTIRLLMPKESFVTMTIVNSIGQSIEVLFAGRLSSGWHAFSWNARNQSSGIYFCRVTTAQSVLSRRLVLLR